eukprot:15464728-Alexandrium_andersonii.AAC.1
MCIRDRLACASQIPDDQRAQFMGRHEVRIVKRTPAWKQRVASGAGLGPDAPTEESVGHSLVFQRSCLHLAGLVSKAKPERGCKWQGEIAAQWQAIVRKRWYVGAPADELIQAISGDVAWPRVVVALRLAASTAKKRAAEATRRRVEASRKRLAERLADTSIGDKAAFHMLKPRLPHRVAFVSDPGQGGRVVVRPDEVDRVLTRTWTQIYEGNVGGGPDGLVAFLAAYMTKHVDSFPPLPREKLAQITAQDVIDACRGAKPTAAGMDGWRPAELAVISPTPA